MTYDMGKQVGTGNRESGIGMRCLVAIVAVALAAGACRSVPESATDASAWTLRSVEVDTAPRAMIASNDSLATMAGIEILRRGGNAIDAAVAVAFALAVTHPEAGNIGGGGFMLVRLADGTTAGIDFREMAPLAATRDMFLDSLGNRTRRSVDGHLAVGVPGTVAGVTAALGRFGTMPLATVMEPAIRLASEGFLVDSALARSALVEEGR